MIYFIRDSTSGHIKIGFAEDPWRRLSKIQSDCPGEVELLAMIEGGKADEAALHDRFTDFRLRGEWFAMEGALSAFVSALPGAFRPRRERKARVLLIERLAALTGVGTQTARSWLDRNAIPCGHWIAISRGGLFTLEELAERHAIPAASQQAVA